MANEPIDEKAVFNSARAMASNEERLAYLRVAAGHDPEALRRIVDLLRVYDEEKSFLESPPAGVAATIDQTSQERPGTVIGPYKLLQQIGEGGMGTVFMAEQTQPVQRKVALKIIKPGMDSRQVIARFEAERQALALMDHPNIAKVLDAGTTDNGRPFFVMELVKGVPITRYCDEHHLTPRQRLELFVPVCQAVQHAHQKGIIHRDLKPSNVMVCLYDGKPVPKVIDFGVAKATGQKLTERTMFTEIGQVVGTLEYMSPEQAELNQLDIDTRSDIYALGVLLYELLAGSPPFSRTELTQAGMLEMLRVIREQEPSKPSTKLSTAEGLPTLAANRGTEPAKLTRLVRGELDWIVMKALEKDRNRRYETANGFAMDVQRYLADEPVLACPPSAGYRLRKFARRNKGGLAVAALLLFFLVLLGSGVGWAVRDRSAREAEAARQQEERQAKVAGAVESIFGEVDRLEKEQKWPEALEAARRAGAAVAGGEADPATAERVHQRLRDLEFIDRLERIRMEKATLVEGRFNYAGTDRDYARAFDEYGVDVDELPVETSIDRLKARRALAVVLAAALDDWVHARRLVSGADVARWKRLVAVARGIDPEPLRDRVRATWGQPVANVRDDLRRLAESIDVRAQHPATLNILALTLSRVQQLDSALRILRDAQYVHPGDFWLNMELGHVLNRQKDHEGAVRFFTAAVASRPSSAGAHVNLGMALADQNKLDEAIACCKKAIELSPTYALAHYDLGCVLSHQKKWDDAIAAYRRAIELNPTFACAHCNLGIALHEQKKPPEAIACYKKAIALDPKLANAYNGLGIVLWDQGKLDEAVAKFRKAIDLNPKFASAHIGLGNALHDQTKLHEAMDAYNKAIGLDPKNAYAYNGLGNALYVQKKLDKAVAEFRKAIDLDVKFAAAHNNLGIALRDQGKLDEAVAECRKAIELDPKDAYAHNNLGGALYLKKDLDGAVAEYRKAIELDLKYAQAHFNLGLALCDQKKWDEAIACYRKAVELDPKCEPAHRWLRAALMDRGRLEEARAAWDQFLESDPPDHDAWYGYAELCLFLGNEDVYRRNRTALLKRFGKTTDPVVAERTARACLLLPASGEELEQAVALADRAVTLGKDHQYYAFFMAAKALAEYRLGRFKSALDWGQMAGAKGAWVPTHLVLAMAHYQLGHTEQAGRSLDEAVKTYDWKLRDGINHALRREALAMAVAECRKAIERDPKDAKAHYNLGVVLHYQGKLDEAVAECRKAIELDPKFAPAHEKLGTLFRSQGKLDEAVAEFQELLRLKPDYAESLNNLAWSLATAAERKNRDGRQAVALAGLVVKAAPANGGFWNTLGAAHYSAGNWKEAIAALEKSMDLRKGGDSFDWFFLAMAHWQLGDKALARKWYAPAVLWMDKYAPGDAQLRRFREEAAALLSVTAKAAQPSSDDGDLEIWRLVLEAQPESVAARYRRGEAYAARSEWAKAAADYAQAAERQPDADSHFWFERACLRLLAGDAAGHAKVCAALLERGEQKKDVRPFLVARACTLAPLAASDTERATRLAAGELKDPSGHWSLTAAAALEVRAGRCDQAEILLRRCLKDNPNWDGIILARLWLALALHGQGKGDEARKELAPALAQLDRWGKQMPAQAMPGHIGLHLHDWLEAQVLRREAEHLLKKKPAVKNPESGTQAK